MGKQKQRIRYFSLACVHGVGDGDDGLAGERPQPTGGVPLQVQGTWRRSYSGHFTTNIVC